MKDLQSIKFNPFEGAISYLADGISTPGFNFSCLAVDLYLITKGIHEVDVMEELLNKIEPELTGSLCAFIEFNDIEDRQMARALWLTWCSLMWKEGFFKE